MLYELRDYLTNDTCGLVSVVNTDEQVDAKAEIEENWGEFNQKELINDENCDVDKFVEFHNGKSLSQIERIFVEIISPN
jgi:hypothetical protein